MNTLHLPVLFTDDVILLPGMVVPIQLDEAAQAAVDAARSAESGNDTPELLVAPRLDGSYAEFGVRATVLKTGRGRDGSSVAVLRTGERVHIGTGVTGPGAALWVEATTIVAGELSEEATAEVAELATQYRQLTTSLLQKREAWQVIDQLSSISDPSDLADTAGWAPWLPGERKALLLSTPDVAERLRLLVGWTREHLAQVEVDDSIQHEVSESVEKRNREFLLREQLKAIRKELGEGEPDGSEDYRAKVEAADLPEEVEKAALREVEKLERAGEQGPEAGWIRTWLDTVLEMPWNERTTDTTDLAAARAVLDADHHGLDDVKDRIVEYLGVRARREARGLSVVGGRGSGAVILLAGPPGVGKTSLGESVARALGRSFVRVALGGVRDEAEVRGHRRTYVGAQPGRLVRALKEAGTMNPVVLLDEVDKLGNGVQGDPAAALLEVLDPAQNHTFRDHYLEVDLDLSDVVFIATANVLETIPQALFDRMELIQLDGYTAEEKVAIARDHLVPHQLEKAALTADEVTVTDEALHELAASWTREAGVRGLERLLAKALRKVGLGDLPRTVDVTDLKDLVGRARFTPDSATESTEPGVVSGLAVTGMGGDVLTIEATLLPGDKGGLTVTGQLGDVMKESAQIALSWVRAHAGALGVDEALLDRPVHVHFPAGAVPKDGPSAGVTMTTALVSLLRGVPVRRGVAMTGEVSLTGRVLPIGGLKQKLLAAQRAGKTDVFIPAANEPDLDDVPDEVKRALTVHPVSDVQEILAFVVPTAGSVAPAA